MTVLNFPASPSVNDVYEANGVVYTWTGSYWKANVDSPTLDDTYVKVSGDTMTGALTVPGFSAGTNKVTVSSSGQVVGVQQTVSGTWNLSQGNNWTAGGISIPQPTNALTGQSGTLMITSAITSWPAGGILKYPGGALPVITSYPSIIPFYVKSSTEVLLGNATQGIS